MSVLSNLCCALLSAATAFTLVTASGCGTDAKGVDDCRDIEQARCAAQKNCGLISDVSACQQYYRDDCLHGLPVSPPSSAKVQQCVATIRAAGLCALQGPDTAPADCTNPPTSSPTVAKTTCEITTNPEETEECSFLIPGVFDAGTTTDAGGSGGAASSDAAAAAGAGGSSGSSDAGAAAQ